MFCAVFFSQDYSFFFSFLPIYGGSGVGVLRFWGWGLGLGFWGWSFQLMGFMDYGAFRVFFGRGSLSKHKKKIMHVSLVLEDGAVKLSG